MWNDKIIFWGCRLHIVAWVSCLAPLHFTKCFSCHGNYCNNQNFFAICNTRVMCLMQAKCRCILSLHCVQFPNYTLHMEHVDIVNMTKLLHASIRRPVRKVETHIILISNWQFKWLTLTVETLQVIKSNFTSDMMPRTAEWIYVSWKLQIFHDKPVLLLE